MQQVHTYGAYFTKARLEAADRLGKDELRTVTGAAHYLGIGKSTLYHLEDGTKKPSLEMLEEIAAGYGVMVGDLLPSSALRSGEAARIVAPLMSMPANSRAWFVKQMASFAEGLAAAVVDRAITESFQPQGSNLALPSTTAREGDYNPRSVIKSTGDTLDEISVPADRLTPTVPPRGPLGKAEHTAKRGHRKAHR